DCRARLVIAGEEEVRRTPGKRKPSRSWSPIRLLSSSAVCMTRVVTGLAPALALMAATGTLTAQPPRTVIAVGTALDGKGRVLRNTRIVVQDGTIAAIDPNASPIDYDLRGRTVMPGWIDTHVHLNWHFNDRHVSVSGGDPPEQAALFTAEDAWTTLQGGFTTV